jgi:hypothetical protein
MIHPKMTALKQTQIRRFYLLLVLVRRLREVVQKAAQALERPGNHTEVRLAQFAGHFGLECAGEKGEDFFGAVY